MDCVFCEIVAGVRNADIIYQDDRVFAFLDVAPATRGHTLVIPRAHVVDIWELDNDLAARIGEVSARMAHRLRDRLPLEGLTTFQANTEAGWQTVFHLHVHLVPRFANDGLVKPWIARPGEPDELAATAQILR